uniref:(northern house mosquito) hypothetical protein n=1 Tax=Culex pipiens TaxID=7175 RepID=A0A8D8D1A9_CULPI
MCDVCTTYNKVLKFSDQIYFVHHTTPMADCPLLDSPVCRDARTVTCSRGCGRTVHAACVGLTEIQLHVITTAPGMFWRCNDCVDERNQRLGEPPIDRVRNRAGPQPSRFDEYEPQCSLAMCVYGESGIDR